MSVRSCRRCSSACRPSTAAGWQLYFGVTQHLGLAEDVLDHRLNSRTVYMNPFFRFVYWNMNYHVEHHMFPMVALSRAAASCMRRSRRIARGLSEHDRGLSRDPAGAGAAVERSDLFREARTAAATRAVRAGGRRDVGRRTRGEGHGRDFGSTPAPRMTSTARTSRASITRARPTRSTAPTTTAISRPTGSARTRRSIWPTVS